MLVDTNILIYYLQGKEEVVARLNQWYEEHAPLYLSVITVTEVLGYPKLNESAVEAIELFLERFIVVPVDARVAKTAAALQRHHRLEIGDALIAATALTLGLPIVTRNLRDFRKVRELEVISI